jgi:hypothetical protein
MSNSENHPKQSHAFEPPQEPEWHRMISEAAYYLAEKRGFRGKHSLDDWLRAEQRVRQAIQQSPDPEATMNDTTGQDKSHTSSKPPAQEREQAEDSSPRTPPSQASRVQGIPQQNSVSPFERFATTQAGGDGIEGDALKPGKTIDEKVGANMADRK